MNETDVIVTLIKEQYLSTNYEGSIDDVRRCYSMSEMQDVVGKT